MLAGAWLVGRLDVIGDVGRDGLTDLRQLLVLLAAEPAGAARRPPLSEVRHLVENTRRSGHPVALAEPVAIRSAVWIRAGLPRRPGPATA